MKMLNALTSNLPKPKPNVMSDLRRLESRKHSASSSTIGGAAPIAGTSIHQTECAFEAR